MTAQDIERLCRVEGLVARVIDPHPAAARFLGVVGVVHIHAGWTHWTGVAWTPAGPEAVDYFTPMGRKRPKLLHREPLVDWLRRVRAQIVRLRSDCDAALFG